VIDERSRAKHLHPPFETVVVGDGIRQRH
jgi:hypothetical protein